MKATVNTMKPVGSWAPGVTYIEATTANKILIIFNRSDTGVVSLGDQIDIDLKNLDVVQKIQNLSKGSVFAQMIKTNDVHDLLLPIRHGGSRFPSEARRAGG